MAVAVAVEKVNKKVYHISFLKINVKTRKFLDVSRCSHAKQRQGNVQNSALQLDLLFCCFSQFSSRAPNNCLCKISVRRSKFA